MRRCIEIWLAVLFTRIENRQADPGFTVFIEIVIWERVYQDEAHFAELLE